MSVKVTHVKVKLNRTAIRAIKQRSKSELQSWALDVLRRKVTPVTPVDTGELRRSADVLVTGGDKTEIWWHWRAPYAGVVEDAWGGRGAPRTPGTIAPFAVPTVKRAIKEEIAKPIGKAFGG